MSAKTMTVSEVAAELKMSPKVARRRLRGSEASVCVAMRKAGSWVFPVSKKKTVVAELKA